MRTKPYIDATRVKCAHCHRPSASEQWNVKPCATGRLEWFALCTECDVELNAYILRFMAGNKYDDAIAGYRTRKATALSPGKTGSAGVVE